MEEIIDNLKSVLLDETRYCSHEDRAYIMAELAQFAEGESRLGLAQRTSGQILPCRTKTSWKNSGKSSAKPIRQTA